MTNKRNDDMREFWLWYQRSSHNVLHGHAVPPPLLQRDASSNPTPQVSPRMGRLFMFVRVTLAVLAVGGWVWALFYGK